MLLTAGEGLEMSQRQEAEERAEAERRAAEQARKEREDAQRQAQRVQIAGDSHTKFAGALSRKVKDDLKDIAYALGLPLQGTNHELISSITRFLETHRDYATNPKFAGLFIPANGLSSSSHLNHAPAANSRKRRHDPPPELDDENAPPTRRLRASPPDAELRSIDPMLSRFGPSAAAQAPAPVAVAAGSTQQQHNMPLGDQFPLTPSAFSATRGVLAATQSYQPPDESARGVGAQSIVMRGPPDLADTSHLELQAHLPPSHSYHARARRREGARASRRCSDAHGERRLKTAGLGSVTAS
ncbi:hypothetical protein C8Q77DRAFT_480137 [Trametes polyzona]|nr:hypothetical protein C8Q77DRAFT_480137 [Trametes polyzona]